MRINLDNITEELMGPVKPIRVKRKSKKRGKLDGFWNALTAIVVFGIMVIMMGFIYLYMNPESGYNPFPQPTLPAVITINTHEPIISEPTQEVIVLSMEPTIVQPTMTPGNVVETLTGTKFVITPTVTAAADSDYPFIAQSQPVGIDATLLYPDRNCEWMGVGGQITDMQGRPYREIIVRLTGTIDGKTINLTSLAGTATKYGEAGYEFTLSDHPISSTEDLWLWLVDQESVPLSGRVYFDTYSSCSKNLIIINFKQVR